MTELHAPAVALGFDLATATGVAMADSTGRVSGVEITLKGTALEKAITLMEYVQSFAREEKPSLIVFEDYAFGSKHAKETSMTLGSLARFQCHQMGLPWITVAPTTLKKFVTGKGNVSKDVMLLATYKRWGIECESHNVSDAIGLAKIGVELLRPSEGLPQYQQQIIDSLRKKSPQLFDKTPTGGDNIPV